MENTIGLYQYKDTTTLQHYDIKINLHKLFNAINPSQVLEIGTSYGGLTLIIRDTLDEIGLINSELRSYDVFEAKRDGIDELIKNGSNTKLYCKNIFNPSYSDILVEEINDISEYIQRTGSTIVMCDGGYKIGEFKSLSRFLKTGDIIMAHDYAPNQEYFEEHLKDKIWNWMEIQDIHIKESVEKHNLLPFMENEFRNVVWVCKIKN
jgi:cephalosporin hydroxylase